MPPILALLLCTIFVLFLLRLERKQAPKVSFALWVPTIWMLLIASKPLAVWLGTSGADMESGSPLDRAFLIGLLCLGLLVLAKRRFNWFSVIENNPWLVLLIGYMLVSVLWSGMPYISFKRWTRELVAVVMAMVVATEPEPRGALQSVFRRTIYVLIPFSILLIKYYPHLGRQYGRWSGELMWIGVALQKNSFARLCLFALFYLVWTLIRRRQGRDIPVVRHQTYVEVFLLILTIYLFTGPQHTLTYSATSTAALAVGLMAFGSFLWMKKRGKLVRTGTLLAIITFVIIYGTITPFIGRLTIYDASSALGRSEDLTGRSDIWAFLVPYAMKEPVFGYGFGGFWTDAMRHAVGSSHAHNGYLEVILSLGVFGLFLVTMFLLSCCRKAQKTLVNDFDWGALWICYLLMAVVHNIGEPSIDGLTSHLTAVLLFLVYYPAAATSNIPGVLSERRDFSQHNTSKSVELMISQD